jgi:hypothetical protein
MSGSIGDTKTKMEMQPMDIELQKGAPYFFQDFCFAYIGACVTSGVPRNCIDLVCMSLVVFEHVWQGWRLRRCHNSWDILAKDTDHSLIGTVKYWEQIHKDQDQWVLVTRDTIATQLYNRLRKSRCEEWRKIFKKSQELSKECDQNDYWTFSYRDACQDEDVVSEAKKLNEIWKIRNKKANGNPMPIIQFQPNIETDVKQVVTHVVNALQENVDWIMQKTGGGDANGIRQINGGRIQIMLGNKKGFKELMKRHNHNLKKQGKETLATPQQLEDCLIGYCQKVVCPKLQEINGPDSNYDLNNFSLIVTYEACEQQAVHVDTQAPNYTFLLALHNNTQPTQLFFTPALSLAYRKVAEWDDLADLVESQEKECKPKKESTGEVVNMDDEELFLNGLHAMDSLCPQQKSMITSKYLKGYGNCLLPYEQCDPGEPLNLGDIGLIKGDQLHAGPECTEFRAVLFFAANPSDGVPYKEDDQFNAATLWGSICVSLYDHVSTNFRRILVEKLVAQLPHCPDTAAHLRANEDLRKIQPVVSIFSWRLSY